MPSMIIGNPFLSGPQLVVSGNLWSGRLPTPPFAGVSLKWMGVAGSGVCYVFLSGAGVPFSSGGPTVTSGGLFLSGGGLLDGMPLFTGDSYWVPANKAVGPSGNVNICALADTAGSGGRLAWEPDCQYRR